MSKILVNALQELRKKDPHLETLLMAEIEKRDSQLQDKDVQLQDKDVQLQDKDVQLQDKDVQLQDKDVQLQEITASYEAEIEKRLALQRLIFGRKSERFVEVSEGQEALPLFDLDSDQAEMKEADVEVITYRRPQSKGKPKKELPRREVVIRVPEEERLCGCGQEKQCIRYEIKHLLNHIPAVYEVIIQKREVLACKKGCKQSIVTAPVVPQILPKARASESLLSYICVSKVLDRQPLYHLEKKIEREHDWHIPRKVMSRWMIQLAEKLQPLVNLMKEAILDYDIAAIDATTLQVLNEPERPAETKSQAYCIRGGPPGKEVSVYEYNGYKQKDYVTAFFDEYTGVISSDASPVFNGLEAKKEIQLSYCHAHARRKFETIEAMRKRSKKLLKPGLAYHVLKQVYRPLYKIESDMKKWELSANDRRVYRQQHTQPILDAHKKWLDKYVDLTPGQSPIKKAIEYSLSHWKGLSVYLEDGRIPIDNNATERNIKPFVISRKNFLFSATQAGADALGIHFSLIISAKHHGLDPMSYYTHILKHIPLCKSFDDYEKLLPWNVII